MTTSLMKQIIAAQDQFRRTPLKCNWFEVLQNLHATAIKYHKVGLLTDVELDTISANSAEILDFKLSTE